MVGLCPNFDDRACVAKAQMDATGAPDDATLALARHASVASYLDQIRIPTLLAQGEADTLFNLQESVATYQGLKARGVPVKLLWQSWGHSRSKPAPGELDEAKPETTYEGRQFLAWFDHYLKDDPAAPSLDFTFFRHWPAYSGDATPAYGRTAAYPAAPPSDLYLTGADGLTASRSAVAPGAASLLTTAAGAPTSYTETSAIDQSLPVFDLPGTFASFAGPPLGEDTDVVGVPSVDVRLSVPVALGAGAAAPAVFFKLYDLAPDGTITLANRLISPVASRTRRSRSTSSSPGSSTASRRATGSRSSSRAATRPTVATTSPAPSRSSLTRRARACCTCPSRPRAPAARVVEATAPPLLTAKQCGSRRAFTVNVRRQYRKRVRSTAVLVDGKRVATLRRGRFSRRISLKGRARATVTVKLVMTLAGGRKVTDVRRYKTCARR